MNIIGDYFKKRKIKNPIFDEGKLAFSNGKERSDNPYRKSNTELASIWDSGWDEAFEARKAFKKGNKREKYSERDQYKQLQPLVKHKYPLLIKIIGLVILCLFLYSTTFVSQYFIASKNSRNGERYLEQGKYIEAILSFNKVLEAVPSSKRAKILTAIAYFSNNDADDDVDGLNYLQGITIDDSDWNKLSKVMPSEYKQHFSTVKR